MCDNYNRKYVPVDLIMFKAYLFSIKSIAQLKWFNRNVYEGFDNKHEISDENYFKYL